jgi:hypothetical protein
MEQALKIALSAQEAKKQEKCNERFYTRFDNSIHLQSLPPHANLPQRL